MTTTTLTLTDFLLARIAQRHDCALVLQAAMRSESFTAPAALTMIGAIVDPREVLAECEAKRRIVEGLTKAIEYDDTHRGGGPSTTAGAGRRVLNHLATVYADHPDFREEWRP